MAATALQLNTLADCEGVIERGMQTFIEVGMALKTIRDDRLYKADYGTFEDYCLERWGWTRQHCNRLVSAADVASVLEPIGSKRPSNIEQVRPLTKLATPEEQQDVWKESWEEAEKQGKAQPTGKIVQEVIDRRTGEVIEDAEIVKTQSQRTSSGTRGSYEQYKQIMVFLTEARESLESISGLRPNAPYIGEVCEEARRVASIASSIATNIERTL